jgi:hypothetical protein
MRRVSGVLVGLKVLHNTTNGELEPDLGGPQNSLGVRLRLVVAAASGGGLVGGKRAVPRHTEASIMVSRAWISSILGRRPWWQERIKKGRRCST